MADQGLLQQVESVVHGLDAAPDALDGLLSGRYTGKVIVEL
jgi:NADPH-dependent curcumin reductase CurA